MIPPEYEYGLGHGIEDLWVVGTLEDLQAEWVRMGKFADEHEGASFAIPGSYRRLPGGAWECVKYNGDPL